MASVLEILRRTNLLTKKQLDPVRWLRPERYRVFTSALADLIHGDEKPIPRLERFVATLSLAKKRGPSWQLATALRALVHPTEHVCVRPTTFSRQAAWMAPRLIFVRTPNGRLYERLRAMTAAVADKLTEAGCAPTDLWDVHDFMLETLRPSAKKLLEH